MNRGSTAEFTYTVSGRHDTRKLEAQFKAKAKAKPTDAFIFRKRNTLAGGSDSEISATYNVDGTTTITIKLIDDDTRALTIDKLYYDVMSTHATNADDVTYPVVNKVLNIQGTITGQLSGLPSDDAVRTVIVDAANASVGDILTVIEIAGVKYFSPTTPTPSYDPPYKSYDATLTCSPYTEFDPIHMHNHQLQNQSLIVHLNEIYVADLMHELSYNSEGYLITSNKNNFTGYLVAHVTMNESGVASNRKLRPIIKTYSDSTHDYIQVSFIDDSTGNVTSFTGDDTIISSINIRYYE